MGDGYYFWLGIFVIQGVLVDVVIALAVLFSVFFLLHKWVNYKINEQKSALSQPVASGNIDTQIDALLQELEGY